MKGMHTYLTFNGNCREAMAFYGRCFDVSVHQIPFSEAPPGSVPPGSEDRIMHATLVASEGVLMASDTMPGMPFQEGNNFSISIGCESVEETDRLFQALSAGGNVKMPPQETFWAQRFAMFTDRFGIHWMLNMDKPHGAIG